MATGTGTAEIDFGAFPGSNEASVTVSSAGHGSRLADYEAQWANKRVQQALDAVEHAPTSKARRRAKREAAREVYFAPLPDVAQVYVDGLKQKVEAARIAELRALMDLGDESRKIRQDIAQAAVVLAQRQRMEAERAIEEFDVMYVATILANA